MGNTLSLFHDPATVISIGVGFFIVVVAILVFYLRGRKPPVDHSLAFLSKDIPAEAGISEGQGRTGPTEKPPQYNAMVFTDEGIQFKPVKEKLLSTIYCDPSMPKSGQKYLCVEQDGKIKAYDPRDSMINSRDSAHRAWRATHCLQIVRNLFAAPMLNWEKLSMIFMWVFCGCLVFVAIIALSKI